MNSHGKLTSVLVTAIAPAPATFRETPSSDYPPVSWTASSTEAETVTRLGHHKSWIVRHSCRDSKKTGNADISLTSMTE